MKERHYKAGRRSPCENCARWPDCPRPCYPRKDYERRGAKTKKSPAVRDHGEAR